jgi:hypothetical protein
MIRHMKYIVNYIRQLFCKHDWLTEESKVDHECGTATRVYMRCKKCGYHQKHWKFI